MFCIFMLYRILQLLSMNKNIPIKDWAEDDRPREKLVQKGRKALSDAELLAILIGSGSKEKSAVQLSKDLLCYSRNNLSEFSKRSISDLCKFKGIGEAKAITIIAALELGRRRKVSKVHKKPKVTSSKVVFDYIKPLFEDLQVEEFHILLLNKACEIIKSNLISQGGLASTVVDGRVVFRAALESSACSVILCHNHPSGQLTASPQDIKLTKDLSNFGRMIDLPVLDHVIYTDNGYFSFADNGML